jgi:hypothetical protein
MRDRTRRDARLVDDSVLDRRHCFSVRGPLGVTFYAADNRATRLAWCTLLKQAASEKMESRITALIASLNLQESSAFTSNHSHKPITGSFSHSGIEYSSSRSNQLEDSDSNSSSNIKGKGIDTESKGIQDTIHSTRPISALEADRFRVERRLQIRINEARKLPLDDRRCWIAIEIGDEFHAKTCVVDGLEPSWSEEYTIK